MNTTSRIFMISASLILLIGVMLGAIGAHALNEILTPQKQNSWELAVQYQLVHGLGLILLGLLLQFRPAALSIKLAGWLMLLGIFLFSGSIYVSALGGLQLAAGVAPYGGSSFMLAWLLMAIGVWRWNDSTHADTALK